ncbi:MAG TPA: phosphatidylserine/phosphatidylglycerophosphate/cardiolipin synthase family protein [Rubrobacteraceae bacterium]|nr:phosphatidylserine/phosphatidylglycerophosphate/cardiolipin synthase family protein [Rubrobacteraceae bacterium]
MARLVKLVFKAASVLVVAELVLMGLVEAFGIVRRMLFWGQPPKESFPWEEQPEIELESDGEKMKLYPDYGRLYEDMLDEVEKAEKYIFVETFIWQDDGVGKDFVDALARKAREGVRVYAIFDELANLGQSASFKDFPEEINTLRFRSLSGPADAVNPRSLHRDHRKILSVDGRVSFVGGFNFGELYTRWRGTHLRVKGSTVHQIDRAFAGFWNTHRSGELPEAPLPKERSWNPATIFHSNDPYLHALPVRDIYLRNMDRADERIYITTAYFTPGSALREKMMDAAQRGVDVQVLIPRYSNHALVDWLARRHFGPMLRSGVKIFQYEDYMLHAKTATVDGVWSTVGSSNVDSLSLFGLHETNLEIYSERLAEQLEAMFELDKTNAKALTLEEWESRPLPVKLIQWALTPLRIFG